MSGLVALVALVPLLALVALMLPWGWLATAFGGRPMVVMVSLGTVGAPGSGTALTAMSPCDTPSGAPEQKCGLMSRLNATCPNTPPNVFRADDQLCKTSGSSGNRAYSKILLAVVQLERITLHRSEICKI